MKVHRFFSKLEKELVRVGKGDSDVTISIDGFSVDIEDIVWHESCGEFHVLPKTATKEEVKEFLNQVDKQRKSWLN